MDFGTLIWVHRGKFSSGGWLGYAGLVLVLVGLFEIAQAAFATASEHELESVRLNVLALPLGTLCLILPLYRWRQSVSVYERGLVWTRLHKRIQVPRESVRGARWNTQRSALGPCDQVELELNFGTLSITGIDQAAQLCDLLNALAEAPHHPATALGSWRAPGVKTGDRAQVKRTR